MTDEVKSLEKICVICGVRITEENDSDEHIIPAAIGGRLRVRGFVDTACNNAAGQTWDAELARQLLPLALHFGIKDRRHLPRLLVETTAGEEFLLGPYGRLSHAKPKIEIESSQEGSHCRIGARSRKEARKILQGLKRRYPNIDVEKELNLSQSSYSYPAGAVRHQLDFGGAVSGRSIVKSALALAHKMEIASASCAEAVAYLRLPEAPACFGYYYASDLVAPRPAEVPLHCIAVDADPRTGLVLGYAEYFGFRRVVLCLGHGYAGRAIKGAYAIDPRNGKKLDVKVRLRFSQSEIEAIYVYKMIPEGAIEQAFAKVFSAALKRQHEAAQARAIGAAVDYALANCGAKPGDMLTSENLEKLAGLIGQHMTPWLLANLRRRP